MHSGSAVRDRHLDQFVDWAKPHIDRLKGASLMEEEDELAEAVLQRAFSAPTAATEMRLITSWRDRLTPGRGVRFSVRRRDTGERVPIDRVSAEEFEALEIVFTPPGTDEGEEIVWQPKSQEALEAIFVE